MDWQYQLAELAEMVGAPAPAATTAFRDISTDSRTIQPGTVFFALSGERFDGAEFVGDAFSKGACAAVTAKAHGAGPCIVTEDPLAALQRFAAKHRARYKIPLLALTGSCGKTSTKDLIAAVLGTKYRVVKTQGNLNNEIGCPLSLLHIDDGTDFAVIEMGANHVGEIANLCAIAQPTEAAITLVAPAHLEGFGSIENVAKAKGEIVENLGDNGVFYVNNDDAWCRRIAQHFAGRKVRFGKQGDVALKACDFDANGEMRLDLDPVGVLRLPLFCAAHASNVMLAVAAGLEHGVTDFEAPLRDAAAKTSRFCIVQAGGLEIIDDTYNANPASVKAALDALRMRPGGGARIVALGDMLELGESARRLHAETGEYVGQSGASHLFARGDFAQAVVDGARAAGVIQAEVINDHADMAHAIAAVAKPGDILLVKGSRGMQMEKVVQSLQELAG